MTKKELDAQARMLAESQQKFVNSVLTMIDTLNAFRTYLHAYQESMDANKAFLDAVGEELKATNGAFDAAMKVFAEGFAAVGENTQKLDKFIVKMDSYFGSGTGLEYDN
jgi:transcription termination factor NusB